MKLSSSLCTLWCSIDIWVRQFNSQNRQKSIHTNFFQDYFSADFGSCIGSGKSLMITRSGKEQGRWFWETEDQKLCHTASPSLKGSHFCTWIKWGIVFLFFLIGWLCNTLKDCHSTAVRGEWMQVFCLESVSCWLLIKTLSYHLLFFNTF